MTIPPRELPARPSLAQYRKQAKDLLSSWRSRDPEAVHRVQQHHPRFGASARTDNAAFVLADAQLVLAREHGFESWLRFTKHIRSVAPDDSPEVVMRKAHQAIAAGDAAGLDRLLRDHAWFRKQAQSSGLLPSSAEHDDASVARAIVAREQQFESWEAFEAHREVLKDLDTPVAVFEAAVEAVIDGDVVTLQGLLRRYPDLIHARSMRRHHSTLLHYVGANGVEGYRQRTPPNAVQVAALLLDAGAEVDATAGMYGGGSTTLGLVATSIHPLEAGVQDDLMALLLDRGARIEGAGAVNGCLANGRGDAAVFLASHGAELDLEGAAGVGRLDVVSSFFNDDGTLKDGSTAAQLRDGFAWACEFGRTDVVDFLLSQGVDIATRLKHNGQTGLHWAALGGHMETVSLLVDRHAPVDIPDESFAGTPLGWALYGWANNPGDPRTQYHEVVARLVASGAHTDHGWLESDDPERQRVGERLKTDARMRAVLRGEDRDARKQ